jgi:hypothetical protein
MLFIFREFTLFKHCDKVYIRKGKEDNKKSKYEDPVVEGGI